MGGAGLRAYLDQHVSSRPHPAVRDAMSAWLGDGHAPSAAAHSGGLKARKAMDTARSGVAAMIGADPAEIVFTSGGTEALNLAVKGAALASPPERRKIVVAATEHPAVIESARWLERWGFKSEVAPVDGSGAVDLAVLAEKVDASTALVCVAWAAHDLGAMQPLDRVAALAKRHGAALVVDATAAGAWAEIDVAIVACDCLALAPHRFHGPAGVGLLFRRRGRRIEPQMHGGIQEGGLRAGTENVAAIVGAGVAAELARREGRAWRERAAAQQRRLWEGLGALVPEITFNGPPPGPDRLPNLTSASIAFVEGEAVVLAADLKGVAMHAGAACVSREMKVPAALRAIGQDPALALGNVSFGTGGLTGDAEVALALDVVPRVVERLRGMSPLWEDHRERPGLKVRN